MSYRIGPVERKTVIAGLRLYQCCSIGAAVLLALVAINNSNPAALFLVLAFAVGVAISGFVKVGGRNIEEWVPPLVSFGRRGVGEKKRFVASTHKNGDTLQGGRSTPPPVLTGVSIITVDLGDGRMLGVLKDAPASTWTGVLSVQGQSFTLIDPAEQEARLAQWASVLSSCAREGTPVHRIQWIERAFPEENDAVQGYARDNLAMDVDHPLAQSYLELIEEAGPVSTAHEIYLAITISGNRSGRLIKQAGGGDLGACELLVRELRSIENQLVSADIHSRGILGPREVARVIRSAFDPGQVQKMSMRAGFDPEKAGTSTRNAWPMATENHWGHYQADGAMHVTFWIAEWPRIDAPADFLVPLLLQTDSARTVSVIMEPIAPSKAIREVEQAHTSYIADEDLRSRGGFMMTATREREYENIVRREGELADGHGSFRFSGYVTVSAATDEELEFRIADVEQASHMSRLDLRRCWGEQDSAFCFSLPIGRGLK